MKEGICRTIDMGSLPMRCPVSCIPAATASPWSFQQPLDPALNSGSAQSLSLRPQAPEVSLILTICPDFPYERRMFALGGALALQSCGAIPGKPWRWCGEAAVPEASSSPG